MICNELSDPVTTGLVLNEETKLWMMALCPSSGKGMKPTLLLDPLDRADLYPWVCRDTVLRANFSNIVFL